MLVDLARLRVRSGKVTERGLAKEADISQPHMHNVLKGIRVLSPDAADRLMRALDVTVQQVIWSGGDTDVSDILPVPLLRNRVGPGSAASFSSYRGYLPFPKTFLAHLKNPVTAYLSHDLAIPPEFHPGDLALLDQNPDLRIVPEPTSGWVVAEHSGLRVRYVRRTRGGLAVGSTVGLPPESLLHSIPLQGRNILDVVRAKIVWIGREMETSPARPSGQTRARD